MIQKQERIQYGPYQLVRHIGLTGYWALPGGNFASTSELHLMAKVHGYSVKELGFVDVIYGDR